MQVYLLWREGIPSQGIWGILCCPVCCQKRLCLGCRLILSRFGCSLIHAAISARNLHGMHHASVGLICSFPFLRMFAHCHWPPTISWQMRSAKDSPSLGLWVPCSILCRVVPVHRCTSLNAVIPLEQPGDLRGPPLGCLREQCCMAKTCSCHVAAREGLMHGTMLLHQFECHFGR